MAGTKTEQQQQVLNRNWHELHVRGKSAEAASESKREFDHTLETAEFPQNPKNKDALFLTELARQNVVTARAAAEKEPQFVRAFTLLREAVQTALQVYPIGKTPEEAAERGRYWSQAMAGENITVLTLRDLLHLARTLEEAYGDGRFQHFVENILKALEHVITLDPTDRFALITLTEEAPYTQAKEAYQKFTQVYGPERKLRPHLKMDDASHEPEYVTELRTTPDQFITVSSRMLARALRERHFGDAFALQRQFRQSLFLYSEELERQLRETALEPEERTQIESWLAQLWISPADQVFKNISKSVVAKYRSKRWNRPLAQENNRAFDDHEFQELLKSSHIGTGSGNSLPLGTR